jgi:hypothetical protein
MQAPTSAELLANPVVRQALDEAWIASEPNDPQNRHEEGGWIYMDLTTGEVSIGRAPRGTQAEMILDKVPEVPGAVVVGIFHTHPNPTSEGWDPGPSEADRRADERDGVPDLIRADNGIYVSGPEIRRGGLSGEPGYPR